MDAANPGQYSMMSLKDLDVIYHQPLLLLTNTCLLSLHLIRFHLNSYYFIIEPTMYNTYISTAKIYMQYACCELMVGVNHLNHVHSQLFVCTHEQLVPTTAHSIASD